MNDPEHFQSVGHPDDLEHLVMPSVWPATIGAGVALMAFGVATSLALSGLGAVLLFWGVFRWVRELRHG